ncbi:SMI1 / KNR4 family protein [Planctomycetes bacterium Pan216]|uniref:SMI1 / KNR4 family protein n=1 Tax=Kolteria novifilia TaxID=2527975 RepID=A0A518B5E0_9BACT|nr:SMI1 / KNR4 family protein [Planctomycetes bacterium Pan216]
MNGDVDGWEVRKFFGIDKPPAPSSPYDLDWNLEATKWYAPPQMVAFAMTWLGDKFCLSCADEDYGNIYVILHDSPLEWQEKCYWVANSFTEFMESLQWVPDE